MGTLRAEDLDVLERLGGGRCAVHLAVLRTTGRVIVVKRAPLHATDAVAGLGREAGVLRRVQHPALVRLLGSVQDETHVTLVLAHAPGGSWADRLAAHGPMPAAAVAEAGALLADALAALHRNGVVHRDVRPANVLVDAELMPVLADLDHATDTHDAPLPVDDEVVGHPAHVDHRAFTGSVPGPGTDLHGLATTLWTAATGAPPLRARPEDPVVLPADARVPPTLHTVLAACTTGRIADAPGAAGALRRAALELTQTPTSVPATAPPLPPTPPSAAPTTRPANPAGAAHHVPPLTPPSASTLSPGTADPTTRRWGPRPPRPPIAAVATARRGGWLVVAAAALLVPVATAILWTRGDDGTVAAVAVTPPAPCADAPPDADEAEASVVVADLGDGCGTALQLSDGVLRTPAGEFAVGRAGDTLVAGDWDGDGVWTPGLYRPATGQLFLFDGALGDGALSSRPAEQRAAHGTPVVVDADGDGRHEVVVRPRP